ncbi:hypothetical protein [Arenimonas sp.]|uniref:hypothetical protein n=1 Tax=Arenimonas sp. TaxID=1872635 RepID=UPI0039E61F66
MTIPVIVDIRNDGKGYLEINSHDGQKKPPYKLTSIAYDVINDDLAGDKVDWSHAGSGHEMPTGFYLHVGPGDSTQMVGVLYSIVPKDHRTPLRIQVQDVEGRKYLTNSFLPCISD